MIKANGRNGLLTCCIRPSSIFGPGDRLLVPSLAAAAKAGKSKVFASLCLDACSQFLSLSIFTCEFRQSAFVCFYALTHLELLNS